MTHPLLSAATLLLLTASPLYAADHQYLALTDDGQLLASGPFKLLIPTPPDARVAPPRHSQTRFRMEQIRTSRAGFYDNDRILIIEVETTDGPPGTLDYSGLPVVEIAGLELPSRSACVAVSQADLDEGGEPLLDLMQEVGFDPTPALYGRQLFLVNEARTAEGVALYAKRVGDCAQVTDAFIATFDAQFEKFVQSIRDANPRPQSP
jgi:hypothetical protein